MSVEVVLATENLGKIREFRELLKSLKNIQLFSLRDFPEYVAPEETEDTFLGNAELKALSAAKTLNRWALADDSGLVVPALGGAPGVYSARYAGAGATDVENRKKLLDAMKYLHGDSRQAYFECCLVLASPNGIKKVTVGKCEGMLLTQEKGGQGFGYDPLFLKYDYDKTFAELPEATKNRISHRWRAFEKLLPTLESLKE